MDLFRALKPLALIENFELVLEPSVREPLDETAAEIEAEMKDGPGYQYLVEEDVDPNLVRRFFTRVKTFLDTALWLEIESSEILVIHGLDFDPLFVSVLGLGEIGLSVFLNREAVESIFFERGNPFDQNILSAALESEPGPGLNSEIREHNWPTHPFGVPLVLRANRKDRPHPTEPELNLLCDVFEAITLLGDTDFFETTDPTAVKLECGKTVRAVFEESLFRGGTSKIEWKENNKE